ncbi:MAG: hypothetical protein E6K56_05785 [Ignavibacteria bacterium]|nr:MAG: hypothetical protein E6K56_05785 [Ignavibacteria bacterium]
MTYRIKLQEFEGPLDLLLFFIKRDELDIYNIPISKITKEFLDYLHFLHELDLEVAGDFIVMAAELMQINTSASRKRAPSFRIWRRNRSSCSTGRDFIPTRGM